MAGMGEWLEKDLTKNIQVLGTIPTYNLIKSLGLRCVEWISFEGNSFDFNLINDFILKFKPCLFIWDPLTADLKKGYLFNVLDISEIKEWYKKNFCFLDKYAFLITSRVESIGSGFVGSVFSDGRGNIYGETLHFPGVSNHRDLSQLNNPEHIKFLNRFSVEEFELTSLEFVDKCYLSNHDISEIKKLYSHISGYFEFIKGFHVGKIEIVTVGYGTESIYGFPKSVHKLSTQNIRGKFNSRHVV